MENKLNMEQVFGKLGDLKQFFIFGQKIVPVIQKIIDFMRDVVPLLENVNNSIQDSTSKIPKAANQIHNVTNATEVATSEILDIVDSMSMDITKIKNELIEMKNGFLNQRVILDKYDKDFEGLSAKFGELKTGLSIDEMENKIVMIENTIRKFENDTTNITISLQIQDITAQQLASVNHLIQSVQKRLSSLLCDLGNQAGKQLPDLDESEGSRSHTFNPDAKYDRSNEKQERVDMIVNENLKTSQAEIDKLFSK